MKPLSEPDSKSDPGKRISVHIASQVSLHVTGENIFRELQERVMKWAFDRKRIVKGIPDHAWKGESFEIDAEHSERAAAIKIDDPVSWAFRLEERLKDANRLWITEIRIAQSEPEKAVFGCRVLCSKSNLSKTVPRSIPNFVRGIVFTQNAFLDDRRISAEPWIIDNEGAVDDLVSFINASTRHNPIVVFALPEGSRNVNETIIEVKPFIRRTVGCVHTAIITSEASYALTDRLGKEFSVYLQAVRTYNPGFDHDSAFRSDHPIAFADRIHAWDDTEAGTFTDFLVEKTLRPMRPRNELERVQPPFQQVKRKAAERASKRARDASKGDAELLRLAEEELSNFKKLADDYFKLSIDEEAEKKQAEHELGRLQASYHALQSRVDTLQKQCDRGGQETEIPDNLDDLESWADRHLAGSVELHSRALRGAKNSKYKNVSLIYNALLLLRDYYVPMRRGEGGEDLKKAFQDRCRTLGIKVSATITDNRAGEQGNIYYVKWGPQQRMLDRHLKKGNSRDPRHCFRLYFFWDQETTRQVVVGSLPSHLTTRAS